MSKGTFPRSIRVGARVAMWSEVAVRSWIAERLDEGARNA